MRTPLASSQLFKPGSSEIVPFCDAKGAAPVAVTAADLELAREVDREIRALISQKNYPCVAAVQALFRKDHRIGVYRDLGGGEFSSALGGDLLVFLDEQVRTGSEYLSFIAVFPPSEHGEMSEEEFEARLWRELSFLSSLPEAKQFAWDPEFSSDPNDKKFCFSWGGKAYFVVGMHPQSSRRARRFRYPVLIFNVYDQFKHLAEQGRYHPMVATNRRRDQAYQGSVNPMTERYGDTWEAIQFSGRENPPEWRCPFQPGLKPEQVLPATSFTATLSEQECKKQN